MNTTTSTTDTAADAVSPLARRLGPPLAIGSVVVTVAVLAWLALAPSAIVGPIEDAPFTVPATVVLQPDDAGCLDVVAGDGAVTTHCVEELATGRSSGDRDAWVDVGFAADGTLQAFKEGPDVRVVLRIDPGTGEVLQREEYGPGEEQRFHEQRFRGVEEVPDAGAGDTLEVYTDGDVVRRITEDGPRTGEPSEDDPVVLDLDGPPGYRLRDAVLSPDGGVVVVTTPGDEVVVAPTDGSAGPYVWAEARDDGWIDLHWAIRWGD